MNLTNLTLKIGSIASLSALILLCLNCTPNEKKSEETSVTTESTEISQKEYMKGTIYTTAHGTNQKLSDSGEIQFGQLKQPKENEIDILVDPSKSFQTVLGIGAALTDAAAETFYKLTDENQKRFMEAYYSTENGIGYSLARTIIHSCDFSSASYTYIEEGDKELKTFSIEHDRKYRLPFTKKAIESAGGKLTMYASPWSPPAFMKTNNNMLRGGKLKPEYYQPWANYYVKFIEAYEAEGIPIWGLTIQNEPMAAQRWESCIYTAEEERDFLKNYLGPTLEKAGMGDKNIIVWDHNRDLMFQRASVILNDPEAAKYVWGTGFHWYEDWKDGIPMFHNVKNVNELFPDKNLIFTEGCNEGYDIEKIDEVRLAERYGRSMINDFNNGVVAWTDWNILLDETGGPNHVGNLCFAPVHGDTASGELTFTKSYYYIGHFSKFVRPGAKRISSVSSSNTIISTGFVNEDGSLVVVVMNQGEGPLDYTVSMQGKTTKSEIPGHAIQSIVFAS